MEFAWNEQKCQINLTKRKTDCLDTKKMWQGDVVEVPLVSLGKGGKGKTDWQQVDALTDYCPSDGRRSAYIRAGTGIVCRCPFPASCPAERAHYEAQKAKSDGQHRLRR
jgi:hypothetical protein